MKKLNKKGFTLTEMIVVIAIIGILAAVLIPSVVIYVQRAQKSNDEQLAASMTKEISWYCIDNNIDQDALLGTDVKSILKLRGYNMVPKTSKWTFVYDTENQKIVIKELNKDDNILKLANNDPSDPTNIEEGYYLIGEGKSNLEQGISLLCNIEKSEDFESAQSLLANTGYSSITSIFNPENTVFINNSGYYTEATDESTNVKIVYNLNTYHISDIDLSHLTLVNKPAVSAIIKSIEVTADDRIYNSYLRASVKKIDVNNLSGTGIIKLNVDEMIRVDENGEIKFSFGEEVLGSLKQEIHIEGTTITVKYFNENGLYAYGHKTH